MAEIDESLSISGCPTSVRGEKKVELGTVSGSGRSRPKTLLLLR